MQEETKCCCRKKLKERDEQSKKLLKNRLNRIIGQLNGINKMIEEDRYCDDVLIQLAAVAKSVKGLSAAILEEHMKSCVVQSIKQDQTEVIDEVVDLFKKFI